ncbi:hypothetical protein BMF94_4470 [Rhodotorula taiwanensis]|uniref:Thioredoxin domain-containing protein n=1 Tax=Rhodotorula taiwanensis TaxID=741276 RepID=A0A2S5B789_9BASI|nr:hypothetical protein BMF94_4470 [Rhodotorula taiwanensis]
MPLLFPDSLQSPQAVLDQAKNASRDKPHYLVFFASVDPQTGKPWCPDCSEVQSEVERLIPEQNSTLVFVGDRTEWKKPENAFRQKPFNISKIPTIIRVEGSADNVAAEASLFPLRSRLVPRADIWEYTTGQLDSAPRLIESELRDRSKFEQFVQ